MKTPVKGAYDLNKYESKSSIKNSFRSKRTQEQFNPSLYISSTISEEDVKMIKQVFDSYDSNGNGFLTPNDLKQALFHQNFHVTKETVYNIIAQYDELCLGGLNFSAFINIINSNPKSTESIGDLKKIFRKYDRMNKGYMDQQDMYSVALSLGQNMSESDVKNIFNRIDTNNTGKIDFQTFCVIMHHPDSLQ